MISKGSDVVDADTVAVGAPVDDAGGAVVASPLAVELSNTVELADGSEVAGIPGVDVMEVTPFGRDDPSETGTLTDVKRLPVAEDAEFEIEDALAEAATLPLPLEIGATVLEARETNDDILDNVELLLLEPCSDEVDSVDPGMDVTDDAANEEPPGALLPGVPIVEELMKVRPVEGEPVEESKVMGEELMGEELMGEELMGDELSRDELSEDELNEEELVEEELIGEELNGEELIEEELIGAELIDELKSKELKGEELEGEELKGEEFNRDELNVAEVTEKKFVDVEDLIDELPVLPRLGCVEEDDSTMVDCAICELLDPRDILELAKEDV
jgi:hypothetical protein